MNEQFFKACAVLNSFRRLHCVFTGKGPTTVRLGWGRDSGGPPSLMNCFLLSDSGKGRVLVLSYVSTFDPFRFQWIVSIQWPGR